MPEPRTQPPPPAGPGLIIRSAVEAVGDWAGFALRSLTWAVRRPMGPGTFLPVCYAVGVRSVLVVAVTGTFIGMVLAVQAYNGYRPLGLESWIASMIHTSVIKELGPVLAATMLAGRVGSAMAAELGTMRVTEQIDALAMLGVDPVHHLVVPRFLACVLLIPLLTIMADCMGILGGAVICLNVYGIDPHHYWQHGRDFIGLWDVVTSLIKATVFGGFIALIACHRGFHSRPGSEGVGRAATESFVLSFIAILALDFFLALLLNTLQERLFGLPGMAQV
jgi:phospholipid/cholesterol/gamma-HCH transport system permease protein